MNREKTNQLTDFSQRASRHVRFIFRAPRAVLKEDECQACKQGGVVCFIHAHPRIG